MYVLMEGFCIKAASFGRDLFEHNCMDGINDRSSSRGLFIHLGTRDVHRVLICAGGCFS